MRLSEFIRTDAERILRAWEEFIRGGPRSAALPRWLLRAHVAAILGSITEDIENPQPETNHESPADGAMAPPGSIERMAAVHVDLRIESGLDLAQISDEFRALRACILRLWRASDPAAFATGAEDINRLVEAIDRALAQTISVYEQREANYRDRFLGMLGHDLRNPLNSISLAAMSLAQAPGLSEKQFDTLANIQNTVRRLEHMVRDILDFARGRLGSPMPIFPSQADLGTLVTEIITEILSANPGCSIDFTTEGDITGRWDVERLNQVVVNLVNNAIQHGGGQQVAVRAKGDGDSVLLEVHNNGPAIPKEMLGTIFDPLVHGKNSERKRAGLGLGLFIVSEIVSAHHGTVSVSSAPDSGTTFTVRLPRRHS